MSEENVITEPPKLVVTQDNALKHCKVIEANEAAADKLGISLSKLENATLESLFSDKTREFIEDMLEYEPDAPDLHDVLSKIREIKFTRADGSEEAADITLTRILSRDANPWFEITFPSARDARAEAQFKDSLRRALESRLVIDEATGLPNRDTCLHFFGSAHSFIQSNEMQAAFAGIRMDRYEKSIALYGKEGCSHLTQHLANSCKRLLSNDDIICVLNDKILAVFLLNFSRESARVLLNRMRWHLRSHRIVFGGKQDFSVTASIAFDMMSEPDGEGALARCEEVLNALDQDDRNQLIEPAA